MRKIVQIFLIIILIQLTLLFSVNAATISGNVYDESLELVTKAIISINTSPEQITLSKDGEYSFNLNPGSYKIVATYNKDFETYTTKEIINFDTNSEIKRDLFLFVDYSSDLTDLNETEYLETDYFNQEVTLNKTFLIITLWIIIMIFVIKWFINFYKNEKIEDNELKEYLDFIKKNKRVTQKEIRKNFPLSESKISLIITELENKGYVEKIKSGRSNVIIYSKKKKIKE